MKHRDAAFSLHLQPITLKEAARFIKAHHRHLKKYTGALWAVACNDGQRVVGVAVVGRPQARLLQDGYTCEVLRCATDGAKNANSMLYAACWRAARALGYHRIVTYNHKPESGVSLVAAGFRVIAQTKAQRWGRPSRPRVDDLPLIDKQRWEAELHETP